MIYLRNLLNKNYKYNLVYYYCHLTYIYKICVHYTIVEKTDNNPFTGYLFFLAPAFFGNFGNKSFGFVLKKVSVFYSVKQKSSF